MLEDRGHALAAGGADRDHALAAALLGEQHAELVLSRLRERGYTVYE